MIAVTGLLVTTVVGGPATASDFLDVTGMKAIYDAETGSLRFEGLFNIHGVGIGRNDKAQFRPEGAATTQAGFSVANEEEAGWLFLDGIEGGSFDAGTIFPTGLSDGLSDFYIGVSSIGSGKNVTPIPIYTPSGIYLPNFDLFATPAPPVVETPPILDPVIPTIPVDPVLPNEPVLPPVVEIPPPVEPSDPPSEEPPQWPEWAVDPPATNPDVIETPTIIEDPVAEIDPPSIPVLINRPIYNSIDWGWYRQEYLTLRMAEYQNFSQVGLGASITADPYLVDMDLNLVVDSVNDELSSIQLAIMRLQQTASPLSIQLTDASTFADAAAQQVAVPEPAAGLALLSGAVGLGACVRRRDRLDQQAR
ncbi:MAG: hypothetical protein C0485_04790 [Pirellula sp.]|nr:hypothetical protein [Pirellula sp.]